MGRNYEHLSREELISLLQSRDRRDETKLGLVWEANEIDRDRALNSDFVALDLEPSLSTGDAPWRNLIIEGDNFDALRYLRMTFSGQVKCILIDPPYNTGEKDFIYNDDYVDRDDLWRHSKWLEFMYQRLTLARDLLSQDGVIFIHIGEEEVNRLGCLMDRIMPGRKVATFVWRTRSGAMDSKAHFRSIDHEYVVCYANPDFSFAGSTKSRETFSNPDDDSRGPWVNDNLVKAHNYKQRPNAFYHIQNPETGVWFACDPDNVWRFASENKLKPSQKIRSKTIEQIIREKKILWPADAKSVRYDSVEKIERAIEAGTAPRNLRVGQTDGDKTFWKEEQEFWVGKQIGYGKPRYKRHLSEVKRNEKPLSTWIIPASTKKENLSLLDLEGVEAMSTEYTSEGTTLLWEILGHKDFPYPKPLAITQALVKQATSGDDLIVDFFAGSGTTAHAVLTQNDQDESARRFILVSSTEATHEQPEKNVCREITAKRVAKVIAGYSYKTKSGLKEVPGLEGDFAYLRCRKIAPSHLLEIEHEQVWTALQLIHRPNLMPYKEAPFIIAEGGDDSTVIYVPRFRKEILPKLVELVARHASVIIYSWQPGLLRQHLRAEHVQNEAIPESLVRRFGLKS